MKVLCKRKQDRIESIFKLNPTKTVLINYAREDYKRAQIQFVLSVKRIALLSFVLCLLSEMRRAKKLRYEQCVFM